MATSKMGGQMGLWQHHMQPRARHNGKGWLSPDTLDAHCLCLTLSCSAIALAAAEITSVEGIRRPGGLCY